MDEENKSKVFAISLLVLSIYVLFIGLRAYVFNNFNDFAGATILQIVIFFVVICLIIKIYKKNRDK